MCSAQLSVLDWMNNSLISKIYFAQICNVCSFQKLKIHLKKLQICELDS